MMPLIHLIGSPYEQGLQHGRALSERIAHNLAVYFECFEHEGKLKRAAVLARAEQYAPAIAAQNADYYAAMQGVAVGAGCSFYEIVALNIRYEILYYQALENRCPPSRGSLFGGGSASTKSLVAQTASLSSPRREAQNRPDGCTVFAVAPSLSANGHLLIGENWDWISRVLGAVLHTREPDGLETLAFTEAGIVGGKIGFNTAGLGLAISGITSVDDDWQSLNKPFHVRCYEILRQTSLQAAAHVITESPHACSANFLIAQVPAQVLDLEAAPQKVYFLGWQDGYVVHSNHFVDPEGSLQQAPSDYHDDSCRRRTRLEQLLRSEQPVTLSAIERYLRDHKHHPRGLCYHGDAPAPLEERYSTVTSVIMDLHEQVIYLTDGLPCEKPYQRYGLKNGGSMRNCGVSVLVSW